jgi:hypothetical protein
MNEIIEILSKRKGKYKGNGENHYKEKFSAELEIKPIIDSCGIQIDFKAGNENEVYHEEHTLITLNHNDELFMWTLCNSVSSMMALEFRNHERSDFIKDMITFGFGHPQDKSAFREEISIVLWYDGDVEYVYSWGLPGDIFKIRSNVRMKKSE